MALILTAPDAMTDPAPGTPTIPDIESDLLFHLRASDLAFTDGASITSMVATGSADIALRTLSTKNSGASFPVMSTTLGPNGGKSIEFNGVNQIFSGELTTPIAQPITYSVVFRIDTWPSVTNARIIGGITGFLQNFYPTNVAGQLLLNTGTGVVVATSVAAATWMVAVFTVQGGTSTGVFAGQSWTGNCGSNSLKGITLGGNTVSTTNMLDGGIYEIQKFARAFTETERTILYNKLKAENGIA